MLTVCAMPLTIRPRLIPERAVQALRSGPASERVEVSVKVGLQGGIASPGLVCLPCTARSAHSTRRDLFTPSNRTRRAHTARHIFPSQSEPFTPNGEARLPHGSVRKVVSRFFSFTFSIHRTNVLAIGRTTFANVRTNCFPFSIQRMAEEIM